MKLGQFVRTLLSTALLGWALPSCVVEVADTESEDMGIFEDLDAMDDMNAMDILSPTGGHGVRLVNDDILPPYPVDPHVGRSVNTNPRNTTFGKEVEMPTAINPFTGFLEVTQDGSVSVVSADLGEIDSISSFKPGSWVLFVGDVVTEFNDLPPVNKRIPLLAKVYFGNGGIATSLEVDVVPGSIIEIPSNYIRVEFFWDTFISPIGGAAGASVKFPRSAKAKAYITRAYTESRAFRSYTLLPNTGPSTVWEGPVPNFSKRFTIASPRNTASESSKFFTANCTITFRDAAGFMVGRYTGDELDTIIFVNGGLPIIPPGSATWNIDLVNLGGAEGKISFELEF